ncbi:N-acetylglucosamine-6-phosphate deacetylase [Pedobacter boryungensis]|uniref:N-acetylglucosamine-6-phosphate deacetylase n=1 Tax=Pedobacter boryungensis TaxID=869962 RepID=A0ABX2DD03_9SPHI|nr:N-acetylglucosamine-6-phosphate deacetylase [Pedobacter boryungensis]NQX31687.1 N-acetylglucosamine-6-phosphate deacetylase [Pedobacter boryungensis]
MVAVSNSRFFKENQLIANETVLLAKGKIIALTDGTIPNGYEVIDAEQDYLVPGFVDLQIYGAGGKLFSADPTVESLTIIEESLLRTGTTSFLACIATNTPEVFNACITAAKEHQKVSKNCLGLHLEGPFLNPKRKGAHVSAFIRKATLDEIKAMLDFGDGVIKMMTIAPELQDEKVIQYLLDNHIVVSLGHSDASFEEATKAYNLGIQTTTHLFNAMSSIHHREPGIPTAVFNHDKAMASIIADGNHVDFEVIKFSQKLLKERMFLITDAVTECSSGPYQHRLVGDKFVMPDGTLSGSSLTMLQAVKNCVNHCDIGLEDALKMSSLYPAKLIGEDNLKGRIQSGYQANMLVLDHELNLKEVIFKGELIHN